MRFASDWHVARYSRPALRFGLYRLELSADRKDNQPAGRL